MLQAFLFQNIGNIVKVVLVGGLLIGGYAYYKSMQAEIATLKKNNTKLEQAADSQKKVIDQLQSDIKQIRKQQNQIQKKSKQYARQLEQLDETFDRPDKYDFGKLALEKPGLIENIINDGTKKQLECLEQLSKEQNPKQCE